MTSERIQRRIDRLLDRAEAAADENDWGRVREYCDMVLAVDASNGDALALLSMIERTNGQAPPPQETEQESVPQPASFANGRYTVQRFLGEGGKKRVYLAHDTTLDRDVAFAVIKTEGLDDASRTRVTREAQAMGRLGDHPHIVQIYDLGEEEGQPYMVLPLMGDGDVEGLIEDAPEHKLALEQAIDIAVVEEVAVEADFVDAEGDHLAGSQRLRVRQTIRGGRVWGWPYQKPVW